MKKHSEKYDSARPYIACFVLLVQDGKVAMVKRKNTGWMDGYYGLPAGKVEYGEPFALGASREAKEEVGVDIELDDLDFVHVAHRHGENDEEIMEWVDVYFEAKKWDGEPHNAEPEKGEQLDWMSLEDLPDNIVPSQRAALVEIANGNGYSEYGW